jgi:hypothetical protein
MVQTIVSTNLRQALNDFVVQPLFIRAKTERQSDLSCLGQLDKGAFAELRPGKSHLNAFESRYFVQANSSVFDDKKSKTGAERSAMPVERKSAYVTLSSTSGTASCWRGFS